MGRDQQGGEKIRRIGEGGRGRAGLGTGSPWPAWRHAHQVRDAVLRPPPPHSVPLFSSPSPEPPLPASALPAEGQVGRGEGRRPHRDAGACAGCGVCRGTRPGRGFREKCGWRWGRGRGELAGGGPPCPAVGKSHMGVLRLAGGQPSCWVARPARTAAAPAGRRPCAARRWARVCGWRALGWVREGGVEAACPRNVLSLAQMRPLVGQPEGLPMGLLQHTVQSGNLNGCDLF